MQMTSATSPLSPPRATRSWCSVRKSNLNLWLIPVPDIGLRDLLLGILISPSWSSPLASRYRSSRPPHWHPDIPAVVFPVDIQISVSRPPPRHPDIPVVVFPVGIQLSVFATSSLASRRTRGPTVLLMTSATSPCHRREPLQVGAQPSSCHSLAQRAASTSAVRCALRGTSAVPRSPTAPLLLPAEASPNCCRS